MKSHLAFELDDSSCTYHLLENGSVTREGFIALEGDNATKKGQLENFYQTNKILWESAANCSLSWSYHKSTLLPSQVFGETNAKDVFQLCFGEPQDDHAIDYNRIAEQSVVNIYSIPDWVKSFFVVRFPRIVLQHSGSHLIRSLLHTNAFKLKINIAVFKTHFLVTITKHNQLIYYSFFDHRAAEDLVYHVSFILQQKELLEETGTIEIHQGVGGSVSLITEFKTLAPRIAALAKFTIEEPKCFMAKSQLLCV